MAKIKDKKEEVIVEDYPVETFEEISEEEMVAMLGAKPEEAPNAPSTHGVEEAYETSR